MSDMSMQKVKAAGVAAGREAMKTYAPFLSQILQIGSSGEMVRPEFLPECIDVKYTQLSYEDFNEQLSDDLSQQIGLRWIQTKAPLTMASNKAYTKSELRQIALRLENQPLTLDPTEIQEGGILKNKAIKAELLRNVVISADDRPGR